MSCKHIQQKAKSTWIELTKFMLFEILIQGTIVFVIQE